MRNTSRGATGHDGSESSVTFAGIRNYDERTIRDRLKPLFMVEGTHYLQPFGGRKTLYIWRAVKELMGLLQETKLDRANSAEDLH